MIPVKSVLIFLIIIVSVGIVFTIGFFIMESVASSEISEIDLSGGTSVLLGENKEVIFYLNEKSHEITVSSVNDNSVEVIIQSEPISAMLSVGEAQNFYLDNQTYGIMVRLNNITDGKADIYLKKIVVCVENWICGDWGNCTEETQTRTCEDTNKCGTEKDKPAETQECEIIEPENNCSEQIETDIDCFIYYAGSCSPSNLTYNFTINLVGWLQSNSYYFEIKDFSDNKCEFYEEIISNSGEYSDSKRQYFLDEENKTEEEIDEMQEEKNDELSDLVGESGTCRYSTDELKNMLTELKGTGIILPISDPEIYECSGTLYETNSTNSSA